MQGMLLKRDLFDQIDSFPKGRLFLLNLAESIELKLVGTTHIQDFFSRLDSVPDRTVDQWWLHAISAVLPAEKSPEFKGGERFATIIAMSADRASVIDPEAELLGPVPQHPQLVDEPVVRSILLSRQHKKVYWLTEARSLQGAHSADGVRDALGLDWIDEDMALYRLDIERSKVATASTKRPSGLCRGTPRFKVRRFDERSHRAYNNWGRTVHLGAWRRRRPARGQIAGAAEVVSALGPLKEGWAEVRFIGWTRNPSDCSADDDHTLFSIALNAGQSVEPDSLYQRILNSRLIAK